MRSNRAKLAQDQKIYPARRAPDDFPVANFENHDLGAFHPLSSGGGLAVFHQDEGNVHAGTDGGGKGGACAGGAGIPIETRFHDLRHSAASLLLAQGVQLRAIMDPLGHSTIALTANSYAHLIPSMMQDMADKMDAVLGS